MPNLPPPTTAPYDTADYVLNLARAIVNDAGLTIAGNLLSDSQPYTFVLLNSAWRNLQDELVESGVETFSKETILTGLAPVARVDAGVQVSVNWSNYFDGANSWTSPLLPQDLIEPLRLWERPSGSVARFLPMRQVSDGLPSRTQTSLLHWWEWRGDALWMNGAMQSTDVRLRYAAYLPDIPASGSAPVPILRCGNALAFYTAAAYASSRGSPLAGQLDAAGDDAVAKMALRTARKKQRATHRRRAYRARG